MNREGWRDIRKCDINIFLENRKNGAISLERSNFRIIYVRAPIAPSTLAPPNSCMPTCQTILTLSRLSSRAGLLKYERSGNNIWRISFRHDGCWPLLFWSRLWLERGFRENKTAYSTCPLHYPHIPDSNVSLICLFILCPYERTRWCYPSRNISGSLLFTFLVCSRTLASDLFQAFPDTRIWEVAPFALHFDHFVCFALCGIFLPASKHFF